MLIPNIILYFKIQRLTNYSEFFQIWSSINYSLLNFFYYFHVRSFSRYWDFNRNQENLHEKSIGA